MNNKEKKIAVAKTKAKAKAKEMAEKAFGEKYAAETITYVLLENKPASTQEQSAAVSHNSE